MQKISKRTKRGYERGHIKRDTKVVSIFNGKFLSKKKPFGQREKKVPKIKSLLFENPWILSITEEIITYYAK